MDIREIQAKSILVKCGIPGIDFVINPYIGCRFGCMYCYASFMGRYHGKEISDWGEYVFAKINAPDILKKEIKKLKYNGVGKELFFSSVTDPYQGIEAKYKLTQQCLKIIIENDFEGIVSILTKSDLVTRDIPLFKKIKNVTVGLTITSINDSISRYFEKFAPPVSARLKALQKLNENGIHTYAFIGPLLPHYVVQTKELENLFKKIRETGTKNIYVEHLNLSTYIRTRLFQEMGKTNNAVLHTFYESQKKEYRTKLDSIILSLVKKYDMHMIHDMVIYHKEFQKMNK